MEKKANKSRLITVGILIFICSAIILFLLPLKDYLYLWPSPPPKEQNRVFHPSGFSIIKPNKWISKIYEKGKIENKKDPLQAFVRADKIYIYPETSARFTDSLMVSRYQNPPNYGKSYKKCNFTGFMYKEGYQYENQQGKYYQWTGVVKLKGDWYVIQLMQPNDDLEHAENVPDYWWPFINSLKVKEQEKGK